MIPIDIDAQSLTDLADTIDAATEVAKSAGLLALEIIGACAALAAVLPHPRPRSRRLVAARRLLDTVACNFNNAKNLKPGGGRP
jgi:hypothetical protein